MNSLPCDNLCPPNKTIEIKFNGRRSTCISPLRFNSIGSEPESISDEATGSDTESLSEDDVSSSSPPEEEKLGRAIYRFLHPFILFYI